MPPAINDQKWSWTKARLKAVYLDAFTEMGKGAIADAAGINRKTFQIWRNHPDYKRYLAELVFSDGMADRVERTKTRKGLAEKLAARLAEKLDSPGLFVGEKVSSLLKALEDILAGLGTDADKYAQAATAPRLSGAKLEGLSIAERINRIADPAERENARRALLSLFQDYIGVANGQYTPDGPAPADSSLLDGPAADGPQAQDLPTAGATAADLIETAPEQGPDVPDMGSRSLLDSSMLEMT